MKLFIGCSSYNTIPQKYFDDCTNFLNELFEKDNELVFGASSDGLMGLCYKVAKNNKRRVVGVSPEFYKEEFERLECDVELITDTISDRNDALIDNADAIIFLPGGVGTLYEFFAAIESKRAEEFDKPIIVYNSSHFYDPLETFLYDAYKDAFIEDNTYKSFYISHSATETLKYIDEYYKK